MTAGRRDRAADNSRFGATFTLALLSGALAAALIAPLVAYLLARTGFQFPFPRIFDRVAMATMAGALILCARRLRLK